MSTQGSKNSASALVKGASELLGEPFLSSQSLIGGDLSEVVRVRLRSGKVVVAKSGPYPDREGRMLRRLADAGAQVPLPIASNYEVLVLEDLGAATRSTDQSWRALGINLRALHAAGQGDRYGWDEDYAFGSVEIHNGWSEIWADFWFEKRLTAGINSLPIEVARRLGKLETRIREILPDNPSPSLLHGDLWSGNVHFAENGEPYLIDPACYVGHAEVDLAMLALFGSPPKAFLNAYGPLEEGWERRRDAYQLWPALVHLRLFGSGYRALVARLATALEQ